MSNKIENMKIGMIVYGSNGDVELFVSLALGLIEKGHKVNLFIITINHRNYSFLNQHEGLHVEQTFFNAELRNKPNTDVEFWNQPPDKQFDLMDDWYKEILDDIVNYSYQYCENSDIVIGPQHVLELACIAEKFDVPYVSLRAFPGYVRSSEEAPYWLPQEYFPDKSIDQLWDIFESYENKSYKRYINKFRRNHDLLPVKNVMREVINSKWINIIAYSSVLYEKKSDWESHYHLCGFFKSPSYIDWKPSSELQDFIDEGEKPVFMTVGTMLEYENNKEQFHDMLLQAAGQIDRNFIIHSDWDEECLKQNVFKLKGFVSYPDIISRCALAVHHGGVGTSHIITEAGCPSIVIKYGCEQPFNAKVLEQAKVSKGSVFRKDLTVDKLVTAIDNSLKNPSLNQKSIELGQKLKEEEGVKTAVEIIEKAYQQTTAVV